MHCDEIRESFVDLLYGDSSSINPEVKDHLLTCAACREELDSLGQTRKTLQEWKDESPLRGLVFANQESLLHRKSHWNYLRYGAIAAMALICFLALSNAELTWNKSGFSFRTSLFRHTPEQTDFYTKSEVRDLMKRALADSESSMNEVNNLMLQKMLDAVEQDTWVYSRLTRGNAARSGNRN